MAIERIGFSNYIGLSTDTKPTLLVTDASSIFYETDTKAEFKWDGAKWVVQAVAEPPIGNPTEDGDILSSTKDGARSWIKPPGVIVDEHFIADKTYTATNTVKYDEIVITGDVSAEFLIGEGIKCSGTTLYDSYVIGTGRAGTGSGGYLKLTGTYPASLMPPITVELTGWTPPPIGKKYTKFTYTPSSSSGKISSTTPSTTYNRATDNFVVKATPFAPTDAVVESINFSGGNTTLTVSGLLSKHLGHVTTVESIADEYDYFKLKNNPSTTRGRNSVNLMVTGDSPQANMVYLNGIKYKTYTTAEIKALPDSELGTYVFDSDLGSLVKCTDATAGANIWSNTFSTGFEKLMSSGYGYPTSGSNILRGTAGNPDATTIVMSGNRTNLFKMDYPFCKVRDYTADTDYNEHPMVSVTFDGTNTIIVLGTPLAKFGTVTYNFAYNATKVYYGWRLIGESSVPPQRNMINVGGVAYKSYSRGEIAALSPTKTGTVIWDSTHNKLMECFDDTQGAERWELAGKEIDRQIRGSYPPDLSTPPTQVELQALLDYTKKMSDDLFAANIYNPKPAEIKGTLIPSASSFAFETDALPFTVEQGGATQTLTGTGASQTISPVTDASEITITLDINATYFKFKNDKWITLKLNRLGFINSLESAFYNLRKMTTFECAADISNVYNMNSTWKTCFAMTSFPYMDTSNVTDMRLTWDSCGGLTSFPAIDISSAINMYGPWYSCTGLISLPAMDYSNADNIWSLLANSTKLVCIAGTLDFKAVTNSTQTFRNCTALVAPAVTGTPVRNPADPGGSGSAPGDNAIKGGKWTNPWKVDFTFAGTASGAPTVFTDASTDTNTSWQWYARVEATGVTTDLGTTQNPSHTFTTPGTYTVIMVGYTGNDNEANEIRKTIIIT